MCNNNKQNSSKSFRPYIINVHFCTTSGVNLDGILGMHSGSRRLGEGEEWGGGTPSYWEMAFRKKFLT